MKKVIILIITHKSELSEFEIISLKQCYNILGNYPIRLICPDGLDVNIYKQELPNPVFDFIDPEWQSSYANFERLKKELFLYERYGEYEHILFYEPDAFVFRDELEYWCNKGYDCIGAPWFEGFGDADPDAEFIGVGNGGFSLRNVKNTIRVLKKANTTIKLYNLAQKVKLFSILRRLNIMKDKSKKIDAIRNKNYGEDEYIYRLSKIFQFYKIPPPEIALKFSFEVLPERLYELNNQSLPFGCHAWPKYNLDFWRPFIFSDVT